MFKEIRLSYTEKNPIGDRQWRNDVSYLWDGPGSAKENKEMVRKAIDFMFKLDRNDCIPCDSVCFDFGDFWYYCEARNEDVWARNRIITVTKYYKAGWHSNNDEPYRIDAATFRRMLYKACDDNERESLALHEANEFEEVHA